MQIIGTWAEKAASAAQLRALYDFAPDVILTGSMGRAAIYASYGYDQAPPLPLVDTKTPWRRYRDIDVLFAPQSIFHGYETAPLWTPHLLDTSLGDRIWQTDDGGCMIFAEGAAEPLPVDPLVVHPITREFLGVSVLTLTVGSQLQMERLLPPWPDEARQAKYDVNAAVFSEFAGTIRDSHPHEFLPATFYAPFDAVADVVRASSQPAG